MATYYVKNGGSDAADGLSESTAWETLAKVNATAFSPGDQILFRRGDIFNGHLVCSSSGTAEARIFYGAYGTGENPTINAATTLTNADFSLYEGTDLDVVLFESPTDNGDSDDGVARNFRTIYPAAAIGEAQRIKIKLQSSTGSAWTVGGMGIGKRTSDQNVESITRITFGGNNSVTIPAGSTVESDEIEFEIEDGADYIVTMYTASRHLKRRNASGITTWYDSVASDKSQNTTAAYTLSTANYTPGIVSISAPPSGDVAVYEIDYAASPRCVWQDDERLATAASVAAANSTPGSWYFDTDTLYIHPIGSTDPMIDGCVYDAGNTDNPDAISCNDKSYNTIELDAKNTVGDNTVFGGVVLSGTGNVYSGKSYNTERHLISFESGSDGCVAQDFEVYNSDDAAIVSYSASSPGCVDNVCRTGDVHQTSGYTGALFGTHGGEYSADNWVLEFMRFHDVYGTASRQGLMFAYDAVNKLTVRYSLFFGSAYRQIEIEDGGDILFHHNIFVVDDFDDAFSLISLVGATGTKWYNNLFVGANAQAIMSLQSASTGNFAKNNIFAVTGASIALSEDSKTGTEIDYNCFPAGFDIAAWRTSSGQDAHSIAADPVLSSVVQYHLGAASPCIGAGIDVGLTTDAGGAVVPGAVGYDIGPYSYMPGWTVFDGTTPTLSLAATCPGSLLEVQEWKTANITKRQIDAVSR